MTVVQKITEELRAPLRGNRQVFVIRARLNEPVALYAQQVRALNLVWALARSDDRPLEGKSVVVVGAGAAGLTAAAAAGLAGSKPILVLERTAKPMGLQLGCHHRFLHPRYFDWPHQKSYMASAHLPILNWSVGTADSVANRILDDFELIRMLLLERDGEEVIKVETRVSNISLVAGAQAIEYDAARESGDGKDRIGPLPCDVVIFAVGFGVERSVKGLPLRSYWRLDPLDQSHLPLPVREHRYRRGKRYRPTNRSRRVLIAGEGDGGIIDVLRSRLEGFDHGPFVDRFFDVLLDKGLREAIKNAEDKAKCKYDTLSKRNKEWVAKNAAANFLDQEYECISRDYSRELDRVWERLKDKLRKDVEVTWLGVIDVPLSITAFPFNRFVAWLLWSQDKVKYVRGSLEAVAPVPVPQGKDSGIWRGYNVKLASEIPEALELSDTAYDEVVVRYGGFSPLEADFPQVAASWKKQSKLAGPRPQRYLIKKAFDFFWNKKAALLAKLPAIKKCLLRGDTVKLRAELMRGGPVSWSYVSGKRKKSRRFPIYQIRLWISGAPPGVRWVEYSLHPEYKGFTRRADRGLDEKGHSFSLYVYTHDDYWVEAKLSTGATIKKGAWLTTALDAGETNSVPLRNALLNLKKAAKELRGDKYKPDSDRPPKTISEEAGFNEELEQQLEKAAARAAAGISD